MKLPRLYVRRVVGHSMEPTLREGQILVFRKKTFRLNSIALARHKNVDVVKRIVRIEDHGDKIWLEGDNADSHHNAIVDRNSIQGVLVWPRTN